MKKPALLLERGLLLFCFRRLFLLLIEFDRFLVHGWLRFSQREGDARTCQQGDQGGARQCLTHGPTRPFCLIPTLYFNNSEHSSSFRQAIFYFHYVFFPKTQYT